MGVVALGAATSARTRRRGTHPRRRPRSRRGARRRRRRGPCSRRRSSSRSPRRGRSARRGCGSAGGRSVWSCPYPGMPLALDLDSYARDGEPFVGEMDREYYLHFAGHKEEFEIEEIYDRHAGLFERDGGRRSCGSGCHRRPEDEERRVPLPARAGGRRAARRARPSARRPSWPSARRRSRSRWTATRLPTGRPRSGRPTSPTRSAARRSRRRASSAGRGAEPAAPAAPSSARTSWRASSGGAATARCARTSRASTWQALERQTSAFLEATDGAYAPTVEPHLRSQVGIGLGELRRADLPYFFRARGFDDLFPAERLMRPSSRRCRGSASTSAGSRTCTSTPSSAR